MEKNGGRKKTKVRKEKQKKDDERKREQIIVAFVISYFPVIHIENCYKFDKTVLDLR